MQRGKLGKTRYKSAVPFQTVTAMNYSVFKSNVRFRNGFRTRQASAASACRNTFSKSLVMRQDFRILPFTWENFYVPADSNSRIFESTDSSGGISKFVADSPRCRRILEVVTDSSGRISKS